MGGFSGFWGVAILWVGCVAGFLHVCAFLNVDQCYFFCKKYI